MYEPPYHPRLKMWYELAELAGLSIVELARLSQLAFRVEPRRLPAKGGRTLRPGRQTPLWNELRTELRPYLRKYGTQSNLARMLGLPKQRINAFVTGGGQMPDAERTLQLLVWLMAVRRSRRPS